MPPHVGLALVLCFVFPCLVQGVVILMDPHGNDTACTPNPTTTPCATLAHAVNIAAHGDRIILNTNPVGTEAIYKSFSPWPSFSPGPKLGSKHVTIESGSGPVRFKLQASHTWVTMHAGATSLTVLGSSTSPIIIEPESPGVTHARSVFDIVAGTGNITMRFVEFRGLSGSEFSPLLLVGRDNVTFTNCTWFGNRGGTLLQVDEVKFSQIESCSFIENQNEQVLKITRATALVRFNTFSRNQARYSSATFIVESYYTSGSNKLVTIVGNSFVNNSGKAGSLSASLRDGSVLTMTNNVVSGSSVSARTPIHIFANGFSSVSITGNTFTDNSGVNHGVIQFQGYDQSVLEIRTNTFTNNRGQNGAGAVSLDLSPLYPALLSDNTFLNNTGTQTGAILVSNGNTTMIRNVFQTNSAVNGNGGAIYGTGGGLSVTDSKFLFNSAKTGGAVYMDNISPSIIIKCEFSCNTASDVGGAMYFNQSAQGVVIENSSFRSNSAAKQGGALHLSLNNQVNIVRNNSFESNWSQSFGGAIHCTSFGETPTLAILENEFTYNVAGGAANTTTFGAAYYTTTCRCANDTTGSSTFTNSSQIIAIEEGEVDLSCPTVTPSPPLFEAGIIHPELACYSEPPIVPAEEPVAEPTLEPTEEPKEPPIALGIVDPPPGGVDLGVGAIVGIVVGIILLLLLLLLLILLILFYRRRRRSAQTKKNVDAGASPTTTTTAAPMSAAAVSLVTEKNDEDEEEVETDSNKNL